MLDEGILLKKPKYDRIKIYNFLKDIEPTINDLKKEELIIKEKIQWLKNTLGFMLNEFVSETKEDKLVDSEQFRCITFSIYSLSKRKLREAYYELCNFIFDYGSKHPVTEVERSFICSWIDLYERWYAYK
jgi:hypothetical protein